MNAEYLSRDEFAKIYPSQPEGGRMRNVAKLSKPRARRDAAKMLGIALQIRYRKLLEAVGEDETVVATSDLAQCMYENIEFVIWALKFAAGMNPRPPEELRKITPVQSPAPKPLDLPCTCEVLEHGIIGRDKHMASCPKFVPA